MNDTRRESQVPIVLLVLLVATWLVLFAAAATVPGSFLAPAPHPEYSTMNVAVEQARIDANSQVFGWLLGGLMVLTFGAILYLAVDQFENRALVRGLLSVATIVYLAAFVILMILYSRFIDQMERELWGPFPAPTSWLVSALWWTPLIYVVIYCAGFRRWFPSADRKEAGE